MDHLHLKRGDEHAYCERCGYEPRNRSDALNHAGTCGSIVIAEAMTAASAVVDKHIGIVDLDGTASEMVDGVTECICSLVRTICMNDKTMYRTMLERCAQRLGDV